MATQDFLAGIGYALLEVVQPLEDALASADAFGMLLLRYGWQPPSDQTYLTEIQTIFGLAKDIEKIVALLDDIIATVDISLSDVKDAVSLAVDIITKIRDLATKPTPTNLPTPLNQDAFWQTFPLDLTQALFANYLEIIFPSVFAPLHLLGIIDETFVPANGAAERVDYMKTSINWDHLGTLFTDPGSLGKQLYGWGGVFDHDKLLRRLERALLAFGLPAGRHLAQHALLSDYYHDTNPALKTLRELRSPLLIDFDLDLGYTEFGLVALPIPLRDKLDDPPSGILLSPYVIGQVEAEIRLGGPFVLQLKGGLESEAPVGIEIRPGGFGAHLSAASTVFDVSAALVAKPDIPWILIGSEDSHRLQLTDLTLGAAVTGPVADPEFKLLLNIDKLLFILDFSEGDGFLQKMVGGNTESLELSATITWSNKTGFGFSGHGSLEVNIPVHLSIAGDVLTVDTIYIALRIGDKNSLALQVALTGGLNIGPVAATVDRIGVQLQLQPRGEADPPGNFGDLDLGFGFKPPNGLGLLIDVGVLTGGGFLSVDTANGRYAGVLQLSITKANLALTVIGLLDTRLPGGAKGFSFLLIITAQFPRIQLGFGFALTGVGGLAGINRSIVVEALQTGVRNHSVDHILFPKNPVAEATQLISDLSTIFPPTEGQYVFGPMASIVWGTPTIIEAELGIILELPHPIRLIILGQLNAVLPDKKSAIVELHLDIVGVLDFAEKRLAIDATLHDSRLAAFNAYGDMALRLSWGERPNFALAVGGLHPQFQAPPGFPTLRRLTVALGTGENPRLSLQTYLAVTSNTIQIGALAELYAEAAGFNIYGCIGFDVLIVLPFSFTANLSAGVALRRGTQVIASVHVSATLTGPDFWHSWGEASISLLFFSVTVHFDATFGVPVPTEVEVTAPWDILQAEIGKTANWSITPPPASSQVVTLTAPPAGDSHLTLLDPLGGLTLREKAVPLDRTLTKFGEGKLDQPQRFTIRTVSVGALPATPGRPLLDHFAPAQFEEMSDAEKLSRPSFERMQAGTTIASDAVLFNVKTSRVDMFTYETIVIDAPDQPSRQVNKYTLSADHQTAALLSAAQPLLRTTGMEKFAPSPSTPPLATLAEEEYVIVDAVSLIKREDIVIPEPRTKGAAYQALTRYLKQYPRDLLEVVPAHEAARRAV